MAYWFEVKKKFPFYFPLNFRGYLLYLLLIILLVVFGIYAPFETETIGRGISFILSVIHLLLIFIYFADINTRNPVFMKGG